MTIATHTNWITVYYFESDKKMLLYTKVVACCLRRVIAVLIVFMFTSNSNADQQPKICSEIHKLLILRQQGHALSDFVVEYKDIGGGGDSYPHLDIDGDGIDDSIVRGCGAGIDSLCSLYVKISSGTQFELEDEERFFLVRVKSLIYIIVGETSEKEKAKLGKRRVYELNKQTIKLICKNI